MAEARMCPICGIPLLADARDGPCPHCLAHPDEKAGTGPPEGKEDGHRASEGRVFDADSQQWLILLPLSMVLSVLCILVGVGTGVYAALSVPLGSDEFWGWIGTALGSFAGGAANLRETLKHCRECKDARELLLNVMVRMVVYIHGPFFTKDRPNEQARHLLQERAWTPLDRAFLGTAGCGLLVLPLAFFSLLMTGVYFSGRLLVRRGVGEVEEASPTHTPLESKVLQPGSAPKALALAFGAIFGALAILGGVTRMQEGLITHTDWTGAFWGGIEVMLGALLGGRLALFGARDRGWQWKGWETVMEDRRWNWFDNMTVAWVALALIVGPVVGGVTWVLLPWPAAYGIQYVFGIFCLQAAVFLHVRFFIRAAESAGEGKGSGIDTGE